MSNLFDLSGRVALVSGAAQGMGRAMALALAEAGADLLLVDVNAAGAEKSAEQIVSLGRRARAVACDVSVPEQIRAAFAVLDREFGRLDFLGNVAGEAVRAAPEAIALEDVEWTWRNLVYGRFCCCQEAGRRMLAAGRGSIVNIGSLASVTAMGRGHVASASERAVRKLRETAAGIVALSVRGKPLPNVVNGVAANEGGSGVQPL